MNEISLRTLLEGDLQAAKFLCDNFRDIQLVMNKSESQNKQSRDFLESAGYDF